MKSYLAFVVLISFSTHTVNSLRCGDSTVNSGLIVGGAAIKRGQWPYIAALFYTEKRKNAYFCGGTIISRRHVITAAHCLQQKYHDVALGVDDLVVHVGRYNISKANETGSFITKVEEISIHPDWDPAATAYDADLAILRIEALNTGSDFIQIACWPTEDTLSAGDGYVIGWGLSEQTNFKKTETIARQVFLNAVTNEYCFLHRTELISLSSNRTFCAGGEGAGPCNGDSGGGFFTKVGEAWYLRGIVSSSVVDNDGRCDVNQFAVFTNVVKYTPWVKQVVSKKISSTKFVYTTVIDEKDYKAYSYHTEYHYLNGTAEESKSLSFKKI